ncbi:hypothetical protein Rsub_06962 [Raphidocelis subcapitata]|uniref:Uncharacterized protein n=1 Tax=Raphidocelis subcapitata TaxID=307507 RepID=A0A2V0P905_9CHLO|nr:hypothetical protein Rsub_06962 [Raphidocelis subcapitata]|eukprot:GBF94340.1 hypothetical protein Rsub_06962 [Raphidocelis subcapitata]
MKASYVAALVLLLALAGSACAAPVLDGVKKQANATLATVQAKAEQAVKLPRAAAQRADQWRSAVLLAWLKESGVYDLLNVTNAATTEVKASLDKHQLTVVPAGPANPAGKLLEYRNALIANWLRDNGGLERIAKFAAAAAAANATAAGAPAAGTVSVASVKDRAPRAGRRAGGEGDADAFKSALLLAWLKDSGAYDRLSTINKAVAVLQSNIQSAAADVKNATARADARLDKLAAQVKAAALGATRRAGGSA